MSPAEASPNSEMKLHIHLFYKSSWQAGTGPDPANTSVKKMELPTSLALYFRELSPVLFQVSEEDFDVCDSLLKRVLPGGTPATTHSPLVLSMVVSVVF